MFSFQHREIRAEELAEFLRRAWQEQRVNYEVNNNQRKERDEQSTDDLNAFIDPLVENEHCADENAGGKEILQPAIRKLRTEIAKRFFTETIQYRVGRGECNVANDDDVIRGGDHHRKYDQAPYSTAPLRTPDGRQGTDRPPSCFPPQRPLRGHRWYRQQYGEDKINNQESRSPVFAHHVGESPDIAETDSYANHAEDRHEPRRKRLSSCHIHLCRYFLRCANVVVQRILPAQENRDQLQVHATG